MIEDKKITSKSIVKKEKEKKGNPQMVHEVGKHSKTHSLESVDIETFYIV